MVLLASLKLLIPKSIRGKAIVREQRKSKITSKQKLVPEWTGAQAPDPWNARAAPLRYRRNSRRLHRIPLQTWKLQPYCRYCRSVMRTFYRKGRPEGGIQGWPFSIYSRLRPGRKYLWSYNDCDTYGNLYNAFELKLHGFIYTKCHSSFMLL